MSQSIMLVSASPRRLALLKDVGAEVIQRPVSLIERWEGGDGGQEALRLATAKAAAAVALPDVQAFEGPALTADTLVWLPDQPPMGKPTDDADAARMLSELSGRTHKVSTGWCVFEPSKARVLEAKLTTTLVRFRELTPALIDAYIEAGEHKDKAGAYAIQGIGRVLVDGIEGSWTNVVGLPVEEVVAHLMETNLWGDWPWRTNE